MMMMMTIIIIIIIIIITYEVCAEVYKPTTLSCGKSSVALSIYNLLLWGGRYHWTFKVKMVQFSDEGQILLQHSCSLSHTSVSDCSNVYLIVWF